MRQFSIPILDRSELSKDLDNSVRSYPLVVLSAAMGYGKTTLAKSLLGKYGSNAVAVRAERPQNDTAMIWKTLADQLAGRFPAVADIMRQIPPPEKPVLPTLLLSAFRESCAEEFLLLCVDNYQHMNTVEVGFFFEALARAHVKNLGILLLTRHMPLMPMAELVTKGIALMLQNRFLAFSKQEAMELFTRCDVNNTEQAVYVWDLCEGWPAGISACLHSYLSAGDLDFGISLDTFFSGSFMSSFTRAETKLLLQLSLMDHFSPAQVVYITGDEHSGQVLQNLYMRNAFLFHSPKNNTFSIHRLFREYLSGLLEHSSSDEQGEIDINTLYVRSAECMMKNGQALPAVKLLSRTDRDEDKLRILELMQHPTESLDKEFENIELSAIIREIPWAIRYLRPLGYLSMVNCFVVRIGGEAGVELLEEAQEKFSTYSGYSETKKKQLMGEIEIIRASIDYNSLEAMLAHYVKANALFGGSHSGILSRHMHWTYDSPHCGMLYLRESGSYKRLVRQVSKGIPLYQSLSCGSSRNAQFVFQAEYMLETGSLHNVPYLLKKARYVDDENVDEYFLRLATAFIEARFLAGGPDSAKALDVLEALRLPMQTLGIPRMTAMLDLCQGYVASVLNKPESIPKSLYEGSILSLPILPNSRSFMYVAIAKSLLVLKEWALLEAVIERAEAQNAVYPSVIAEIHILVLKSILEKKLYQGLKVDTYMLRALDLARPDGLVTCIAEYGTILQPLQQRLQALYADDPMFVILGKQLKKYTRGKKNRPFSARQEEALALLATGASNRVIASQLGLSVGSLANMLTDIYKKMGVSNRTEALITLQNRRGGTPGMLDGQSPLLNSPLGLIDPTTD